MASGTLSEPPPPAPPPTAVLDHLTHLTSEQQAVKQALSNPLGQAAHSDQTSSTAQQTTALIVSQRANTQPTATNCLLPYIDPKSEAQPSPSAVTNDLLPQDLLFSLKRQQGRALNPLSPPQGVTKFPPRHVGNFSSPQLSKQQPPVGPGTNIVNRPPANVWNYPHRRTRLRHLTEAPPCVCGAGRDISFLYDSASLEQDGERAVRTGKVNALPNTLIPEEYHIVKHPGVLGLEFHDE